MFEIALNAWIGCRVVGGTHTHTHSQRGVLCHTNMRCVSDGNRPKHITQLVSVQVQAHSGILIGLGGKFNESFDYWFQLRGEFLHTALLRGDSQVSVASPHLWLTLRFVDFCQVPSVQSHQIDFPPSGAKAARASNHHCVFALLWYGAQSMHYTHIRGQWVLFFAELKACNLFYCDKMQGMCECSAKMVL